MMHAPQRQSEAYLWAMPPSAAVYLSSVPRLPVFFVRSLFLQMFRALPGYIIFFKNLLLLLICIDHLTPVACSALVFCLPMSFVVKTPKSPHRTAPHPYTKRTTKASTLLCLSATTA